MDKKNQRDFQQGKQPTIEEAQRLMNLCYTKEQQKKNMRFWRDLYGMDWCKKVLSKVKWKETW